MITEEEFLKRKWKGRTNRRDKNDDEFSIKI